MDMGLKGRTAFVTGASRGIGREIARGGVRAEPERSAEQLSDDDDCYGVANHEEWTGLIGLQQHDAAIDRINRIRALAACLRHASLFCII